MKIKKHSIGIIAAKREEYKLYDEYLHKHLPMNAFLAIKKGVYVKPIINGYKSILGVSMATIHGQYTLDPRRKYPAVPYDKFQRLIYQLIKAFWSRLYTGRQKVYLPENGGSIAVRQLFNSNPMFFINRVKSYRRKKICLEYNHHTDGKRFAIKWDKTLCKWPNAKMYVFKAERNVVNKEDYGKYGLAIAITSNNADPTKKPFVGFK